MTTKVTQDKAIKNVLQSYYRSSSDIHTRYIEEILAKKPQTSRGNDDTPSESAEAVREYLWTCFSGGGVSALATKALFTALGREEELVGADRWL